MRGRVVMEEHKLGVSLSDLLLETKEPFRVLPQICCLLPAPVAFSFNLVRPLLQGISLGPI